MPRMGKLPSCPEEAKYSGDQRLVPLYDGSRVNKLEAVTLILEAIGKHPGVSQAAVTDLLLILRNKILPVGNRMPPNYRAAKAVTEGLDAEFMSIDVCKNDCSIYKGESANLDNCSKCGESRWDSNGKAQKSFHYIPLIPRIQRLFQSRELAASLRAHDDAYDNSLFKSRRWAELYSPDGPFAGDKRCLSLAICADGFDPFNHNKVQYSMTPVLIRCMNLPADLRDKIGMLMLSTLIPGKNAPNDMAPYLQPLAEELHRLGDGVQTYDCIQEKSFNLKARLIYGVFDTPGAAKFTKTAGVSSLVGACSHCTQEGDGKYVKELSRTLYMDSKRFLPIESPLRGDETRPPPLEHDREKLFQAGELVEQEQNDAKRRQLQKTSGKKGRDGLAGIPGYLEIDYPVDVMHTLQVVAKKFHAIFTGYELTEKVVRYETDIRNSNVDLYRLTDAQKKEADRRLEQEIHVPVEFGWTPKPMFKKTPYLTCHEWKQISTHGILKYALRGLLGTAQQDALFQYLDVLAEICNSVTDIDTLERTLQEAIVKIADAFPLILQTICLHKMQHVPSDLRIYGNVQATWMYPFERFMAFLKGRIKNRQYPEASAVQSYVTYETTVHLRQAGIIGENGDHDADDMQSENDAPKDARNPRTRVQGHNGAVFRAQTIIVSERKVGRVQSVYMIGDEGFAEVAWFGEIHFDGMFQWVQNSVVDNSTISVDKLSDPIVSGQVNDRIYLLNTKICM